MRVKNMLKLIERHRKRLEELRKTCRTHFWNLCRNHRNLYVL